MAERSIDQLESNAIMSNLSNNPARRRYDVISYVSDNVGQFIESQVASAVDGEYTCVLCEAKYDNCRSFRIHLERHVLRYICTCGSTYSSRDGTTRHVRKECVHKGFFYQVCYQSFNEWKAETGLLSVDWVKDTEYDVTPGDGPCQLEYTNTTEINRYTSVPRGSEESQQESYPGGLWGSSMMGKVPNPGPPLKKSKKDNTRALGSNSVSMPLLTNYQHRETVRLPDHFRPAIMPELVQLSPSPPPSESSTTPSEPVIHPKPTTSVQPLHIAVSHAAEGPESTQSYTVSTDLHPGQTSNDRRTVIARAQTNRPRRDYAGEIATYEAQRYKLLSLVDGLSETIDRLRLEWSQQEIAETEYMISEAQTRPSY